MDPCTHINRRTQTALVTLSHVRGGKRRLKQPKDCDGDIRQVGKLSWHRVWWLSPSQGCHGTRCCYQNFPEVMVIAGLTCISEARRKQHVKKKRLLEACGDSA